MPAWVMWVLGPQQQLFSSLWMCFSCTALLAKVGVGTKTTAKAGASTWNLLFLLTSGPAFYVVAHENVTHL